MKTNPKVSHIRDKDGLISLLRSVEKAYKDDTMTELICIARIDNHLEYSWFGERSTLYQLGLLERMKGIIMDWINASNASEE